jgi:hypothetical protein
MTITDDDTGGSGDGRGSREITGLGCHVGGGTAVHEREVTCATSSASVGGGVEGVQQRGVDLRRRGRAIVAGWSGVDQRHDRLGRREERLVGCWSGPQDAGVLGPWHRHGVGVDDSGLGMLARGPGRRRRGLLGRRRVAVALAAIAAMTALTLAASIAACGRGSGRIWSGPAIGEDALSAGPKGGHRLLGWVVGSWGAG